MLQITKENRDALIEYFTRGNGKSLPYGDVAPILQILVNLKEIPEVK